MKEKFLGKKSRGQVAIEFIFIVLLIVIYLFTTTRPLIQEAQAATGDMQRISMANNEAQKIVNSITRVSLLGVGSKETLQIFLPLDSNFVPTITCDTEGKLAFNVPLEAGQLPNECPLGKCKKEFEIPEGLSLDCDEGFELVGRQKIIITKSNDDTIELLPGE